MCSNVFIRSIDLEKTGRRLRELIIQNGYSVKDIQKQLHLSCPQPIYRWMKGQMLPTVDHLYALAKLFHIHMEEILMPVYVIRDSAALHKICSKWNQLLILWRHGSENTKEWRTRGVYERLDSN